MDWVERISSLVEDYTKKKLELNKALAKLLNELKISPHVSDARFNLASLSPFVWDVELEVDNVGSIKIRITQEDIFGYVDSDGEYKSRKLPEEAYQAFKDFLVRKIEETLIIN